MTIKTDRLYITVANQIINRINAKQYLVGEKIPPERKLSEELNVSRTVIREAMVYLELSGSQRLRKGQAFSYSRASSITFPFTQRIYTERYFVSEKSH